MNTITDLLSQYGYIALYVALTLELIAFPTPGETLMTYCGFLSSQGQLNWGLSILVASLGIITGITTSYFIGFYLGSSFFEKHGERIHMGPKKMQKATIWFEKYGNGLLIVAYFIPGIRHVTGYFAGITKISYKKFAITAYIGAFLWAGTFISLGKVLGVNWEKYHAPIKKYFIILAIAIGLILVSIYLFKNFKVNIIASLDNSLKKSIRVFHSLGKIRLVLSSYQFLIPVCIFILIWIIIKGKDKSLETRIFIIMVLGSEILEELSRRLFHLLNPAGSVGFSFPSEQSFLAIVIYGFAAFIIYRHIKIIWVGVASIILSFMICLTTGLGIIYTGLQKPSDILAGYVFGSLILGIIITLLEIYRILLSAPMIKRQK